MVEPTTIIIGIITAAILAKAIYKIVHYAYLTWSVLKDWADGIRARKGQRIATYKSRLESGETAIIAGVFDKKTERVVGKLKAFSYDSASKKVKKRHRGDKVKIWN